LGDGWERGLGGLVVDAGVGFRGPGLPNGPPSPRLAPGGFYGLDTGGLAAAAGEGREARCGGEEREGGRLGDGRHRDV
jgi:hypothetical protein